MTQRAKEMLELADLIASVRVVWVPMSGDVRNVTFTLDQADRVIEALRLAAQADAPGEYIPSSAEPACGDYSQASQHRSGDPQPGSAEADPGGLDAATVEACALAVENYAPVTTATALDFAWRKR